MRRSMTLMTGLALLLAGCGSGSAPSPTATPAGTPAATPVMTAAPTPAPTAPPTPSVTATSAPSAQDDIGGPGDYEPGAVRFRIANVSGAPVDVYVRTQGLVKAYLISEGLATGAVTDYIAPPDPGTLVVTKAGAGDPACVASCPHFIGTWTTTSGNSDQHTVILADTDSADLWEHPRSEDVGKFANALPAGDPARATFFVAAGAVSDARFGLRLAFASEAGCQVDVDNSNVLIGGTSILPFTHGEPVDVTLHLNTDRQCAEPVGGPFALAGAAGSRSLLILWGAPGAMEALVLPIE